MANPKWIKGTRSPNPKGRPKNPSRSVQLLVARFLKTNMQGKRLQALYDKLKPEQQAELIYQLLPYAAPKMQPDEPAKNVFPFAQLNIQVINPVKNIDNGNGSIGHKDNGSIPAATGNG